LGNFFVLAGTFLVKLTRWPSPGRVDGLAALTFHEDAHTPDTTWVLYS